MFRIFLSPHAEREFNKLAKELRQQFYDELIVLSKNPLRHRHSKKIRGSKFGYRLRLGRWRILFAVFRKGKRIEVVDIFLKKGRGDYTRKRKLF